MTDMLKPRITDAGRAAIAEARVSGTPARITHVGVGENRYEPSGQETQLKGERERVPVSKSSRKADAQIHVSAVFEPGNEYWVREVGFFLEGGTLLAVYSHPQRDLAFKGKDIPLVLALDLLVGSLDADVLEVSQESLDLNLFLTAQLGQIATAQVDGMRRDLELEQEVNEMRSIIPARASSGFLQPPNWTYSSDSERWQLLWDEEVEVASDSSVLISIMGHWRIQGSWAYLGAMVDGEAVHPDPDFCSGATFTQLTQGTLSQPIGYTACHQLKKGKHRLGVGVVVKEATVWVGGTRLYYLFVPA